MEITNFPNWLWRNANEVIVRCQRQPSYMQTEEAAACVIRISEHTQNYHAEITDAILRDKDIAYTFITRQYDNLIRRITLNYEFGRRPNNLVFRMAVNEYVERQKKEAIGIKWNSPEDHDQRIRNMFWFADEVEGAITGLEEIVFSYFPKKPLADLIRAESVFYNSNLWLGYNRKQGKEKLPEKKSKVRPWAIAYYYLQESGVAPRVEDSVEGKKKAIQAFCDRNSTKDFRLTGSTFYQRHYNVILNDSERLKDPDYLKIAAELLKRFPTAQKLVLDAWESAKRKSSS